MENTAKSGALSSGLNLLLMTSPSSFFRYAQKAEPCQYGVTKTPLAP